MESQPHWQREPRSPRALLRAVRISAAGKEHRNLLSISQID